MRISKLYDEAGPYIIDLRRWFHAHPELSLEEKETSEKIKAELTKMGIPFEELKPNYGIVATIEGKSKGKTIAVRADIDALPIKEETGLPYASQNENVMHACGHDAHAAMLLGAAKVLSQVKDELNGTVKLVFQVAEETGLGYEEILDYFDAIGGVDEVIGLHIWSTLSEGEILLIPNSVFAGSVAFNCEVHGQGGHGARPDLVKDPIKAACDLVLKFAGIPSNFYDVLDHSVVTTCLIEAGTMSNIFPSDAVFKGSIRYYKNGGGEKVLEIMKRMAEGAEKMYGVQIDLKVTGSVIPVHNQEDMIVKAMGLIKDIDGLEISPQTEPICASDNFGYILGKHKGFYGILGAGKRDAYNYPQHHCKFELEEASFRKGSEFMARYVCDYLMN